MSFLIAEYRSNVPAGDRRNSLRRKDREESPIEMCLWDCSIQLQRKLHMSLQAFIIKSSLIYLACKKVPLFIVNSVVMFYSEVTFKPSSFLSIMQSMWPTWTSWQIYIGQLFAPKYAPYWNDWILCANVCQTMLMGQIHKCTHCFFL